MKTIKKVPITPVFVQFIPDILEDNHVYITLEYESSTHKCLCGCGNINILPLHKDGWTLEVSPSNKVTFSPSILHPKCMAHYVIQNNIANFV